MFARWDETNNFNISHYHKVLLKYSWDDEAEYLQCIIRDLEHNVVLATLGVGGFIDGMIEYYAPLIQTDVQPLDVKQNKDGTFSVNGGYTLRMMIDPDYVTKVELQNIPKAILRLGDTFMLPVQIRTTKERGVKAYSNLVTGGITGPYSVMKAEAFTSLGTLVTPIKSSGVSLCSIQDISLHIYSAMLNKGGTEDE